MQTAKVMLTNGVQVNKFVSAMSKYKFPIYLTTSHYKVDAKSMIGVFGIDLSSPVTVEYGGKEEVIDPALEAKFLADLKAFSVE